MTNNLAATYIEAQTLVAQLMQMQRIGNLSRYQIEQIRSSLGGQPSVEKENQ